MQQNEHSLEPNETPNTAYLQNLNSAIDSELLLGSLDQSDVYAFELSSSTTYTLSALTRLGPSSSTIGGLRFEVIDRDSNPVTPEFDLHQGQQNSIDIKPPSDDRYFLKISAPDGTIYEQDYFDYLVSVWEPRNSWGDPFSGENYEPNESAQLAYVIDVSEQVASNLDMGVGDQIDMYKVNLYPGNKYRLSVTATDGPNRGNLAALRLKVVDSGNTRLFIPEQTLAVGSTYTFDIAADSVADAIIQLYYIPTSGHEQDSHAYELNIKTI